MLISIHIDKFTEEQLKARDITADKLENLISGFFCINKIGVTFVADSNHKERCYDLSEHQIKILSLSSRGNTYKLIGEKLNIEEATVKFHMKRIKEVLNVSTLGQAIKVATECSII